jgi:hypothetical protein
VEAMLWARRLDLWPRRPYGQENDERKRHCSRGRRQMVCGGRGYQCRSHQSTALVVGRRRHPMLMCYDGRKIKQEVYRGSRQAETWNLSLSELFRANDIILTRHNDQFILLCPHAQQPKLIVGIHILHHALCCSHIAPNRPSNVLTRGAFAVVRGGAELSARDISCSLRL